MFVCFTFIPLVIKLIYSKQLDLNKICFNLFQNPRDPRQNRDTLLHDGRPADVAVVGLEGVAATEEQTGFPAHRRKGRLPSVRKKQEDLHQTGDGIIKLSSLMLRRNKLERLRKVFAAKSNICE